MKIKLVYKSLHSFGNCLPGHDLHRFLTIIELRLDAVVGAKVLGAGDKFSVPVIFVPFICIVIMGK